ncbi:glutamate-rich protein 2 isoform X3 [Monodelphis domestica]|uniref:glutamate-rich protein 2 isoform X3 n=1 Tax=Monodelphis domestica TaxID=13616 RepID=UPI00044349BE|nr:glutamate-rich protein 2 isoform X3 [Monodelphis domestica]
MSRYSPRCSGAPRTVPSKAPRMLEVIGPEGEIILETDLRISGRNCLDTSEVIKEPKNRYYSKLQVLDAKEEVVIEPAEAMSRKGLLRNGKELASKPHTPATQSSQSMTKISSEKKKISSKSNENKDLFMNSDNKSQTSSIVGEKTESDPNISAPKKTIPQDDAVDHNSKGTDEDAAVASTGRNNESSESPDDRLSENIKDDNEKGCSTTVFLEKNVAPLELMTEFLRAVMGRNYTVAKKLCEMILVYEPENPEAKQFSSLIEEKLLMEKTHSHEEESEDSSDDSEESSDEESEDSSDESEEI